VEVIVQLERKAADDLLRGSTSNPDVARLRHVLSDFGVTLRPQHPGIRDADLSRYFVADVRDWDEGARVVAALTALRFVSAAYAKPQAEPP
jgi:hypothetical protein